MSEQAIRVLVIDDSPEDRQIFRRYLTRNTPVAYQISEAASGEEGLQLCASFAPDCLIMDYNLPDLDGMVLLNRLQEYIKQRELAIIFLTGSGNERLAVNAMKHGVQDYLVKGKITPDELRLSITRAIEKVRLTAQLKQQQELITRQYEIFWMLAENSRDGIIRMDSDLRYTYINPSMWQLMHWEPALVIGKTIQELSLPEGYVQIWEHALKESLTTGHSQDFEYNFQTEDGVRYLQTRIVPENDQFGQLISVVGMTRDVSEQKEELQKKDNFISMVSHELRTPLTALQGNVQLAMRSLQALLQSNENEVKQKRGEEANARLQRVLQLLRLEGRLISDLLDVSRMQADKLNLQLAPEDLRTIIQTVIEEQRQSASQRSILLSLPDETVPVVIDRNRIEQVTTNYLTNALRYSAADKPIKVGITVENQQARVWVKDYGAGLTDTAKQHIWERFYQVNSSKNTTGGLGLGLYICHMLISLHGGTVGVESEPGNGSTFWFVLPLNTEAPLESESKTIA